MKLQNSILRDCVFDGVNLTNADLEGADMRNSRYNVQDLWKANFKGAKLHGDNIISSAFGGYHSELFVWGKYSQI